MANIKSQIKRIRTNEAARVRNKSVKSALKTTVRSFREAAESVDKPNLSMKELIQIADDYARDWDLGPDAHPCDIKSSIDPSGRVRSGYVPSPVMIA